MIHKIEITTTDALLLNKVLKESKFDADLDERIASALKDKINRAVEKDTTKKATNLEGKCGSCRWAEPRMGAYIDCKCPSKKPNWFARTCNACKKYEKEEEAKQWIDLRRG